MNKDFKILKIESLKDIDCKVANLAGTCIIDATLEKYFNNIDPHLTIKKDINIIYPHYLLSKYITELDDLIELFSDSVNNFINYDKPSDKDYSKVINNYKKMNEELLQSIPLEGEIQ